MLSMYRQLENIGYRNVGFLYFSHAASGLLKAF